MTERRLKTLMKDKTARQILTFIPNNLGINLCSVDDIRIYRQNNGEIKSIHIIFTPTELEDKHGLVSNKYFYVPC